MLPKQKTQLNPDKKKLCNPLFLNGLVSQLGSPLVQPGWVGSKVN